MGHGSTGIGLSKAEDNPFAKATQPTAPKQFDAAPFAASASKETPQSTEGTTQYDKVLNYLMQMNQGR